MNNINISRILLLFILTCSVGAVVVQAQNYTVILSYGQTPYQLGYLSQGNATGWTWWDTDGGVQQKNLILVSIMENTTPVSGLSPPAWIQDSSQSHNIGGNSWKAGEGIHSWHYLDDFNTPGTPLEDIVLSDSQENQGLLNTAYNWLNELVTGVQPTAIDSITNMTYWTNYNMTENYGSVKVSVDRGETWETLEEYSGNSNGWVEKNVDLAKYNEQQILIAFYFSSNGNNNEEWWIDDIKVMLDGVVIFSDDAENPPPVLTANVIYPHYNYSSDYFSSETRTISLVEDYAHQIYYGVFNYPDDAYTGEYQVDFSTTINSENLQASTSFRTTLWGCQAEDCHDSWSPESDSSMRNPTVMIHPDNITTKLSGNCLGVCHSTYSSQFLRASPVHLHDLKYGHEGGFIYGAGGWTTIYDSLNVDMQMYYRTSINRPISQTTFNVPSHVTGADCVDCHTNFVHDRSGIDTYDIADPYSLSGTTYQNPTGVHDTVSCEACHGIYNKTIGEGLYYPTFDTTTTQLDDSIGDYGPEFMSYESMTKTYIIDMDNSGTIDVTVTGDDNGHEIFLSLIGPIDDQSSLQDLNTTDWWEGTYCVPSVNGTATFATGSKIYFPTDKSFQSVIFDSSPRRGIWIAKVFLQFPGTFNYTITSSHPIQQKPIIHIPWNCSECHNPSISGDLSGANTLKPMPSWDNQGLSYTHTDYNNDSKDDVTCRLCHNSFHNISIKNCTDCHIQPPGGHGMADYYDMGYTGCIGCHKDPHFEPEAAAGGNCTDCHLEGGTNATTGLPIISRDGFFNSSHTNITGDFNVSNYSDISRVCWGCHVNYTQELIDPTHTRYASELPDCEDCHFNETPLNGEHLRKIPPIQIPEHQPQGVDVQTNISTNCTFCHNNSLSIPIPTINVKYAEAKNYVSHYVDTVNLMTPNSNTTDCWWCHVDNSDNVSWGKPTDPFTSTNYNHTPLNLFNSAGCYPCHVSNKATENDSPGAGFTFHNDNMGPGAGENCTDCHLEGGNNVISSLLISKDGFFKSSHTNITGDFNASNYSDISRVCWGCHVNYTEQLINPGHTRRVSELPDCEDCHFSETPLNGEHLRKIPPIQIPEHQPLGVDVQTSISTNCTLCHSNSLSIPITTNVKYSEAKNYVSHYVDTVNLMTTTNNTTDCWWCHVDNSDNVSWGNPTDPFTSTLYKHTRLNLDSRINCYPCHISNEVMENGNPLAGFTFHNDSMVPGAGENCTDCHLEGGNNVISSLLISKDGFFKSSHSNITGDFNPSNYSDISRVCWGCHVNYTEQLINPGHTRYIPELPDCEDCHFSETPLNGEHLRKLPPIQIPEHQPQGVDVKTNISTNCILCHNNSLSIPITTTNVKYGEAKNYVSHYVDTVNLMTTTNNTTDCWWCHVDNSDNVSWGSPTDPFTSTEYKHTIGLNLNNRIDCYPCHISNEVMENGNPLAGFTFHNDSMAPGAGKYCVSCHDVDGMVREDYQIDVQAMNRSGAIHYDLNRGATNTSGTVDPNNVRCWACHGDGNGSEAAQPTGHPVNFSTPKNCGDRECHNFNQSIFYEPMVYEHIRYVDEIDEHVNTTANCLECHKNSIESHSDNLIPNDISLVSHYGSIWNLVNTSDCIYCHLDEDNAEEWGNAPDPRNHTHYDFVEKTLIADRPWKLVDNYSITLIETTSNAAKFIFEKDGEVLEREILSLGDELNFEISGIEDDNTSIVNFTITKIFKGRDSYAYVVDLSGDVLASRIHKETNNIACYACHDREYRANVPDGRDYYILEKDKKDDENVTLGLIYVNFEESDKKMLQIGEHWELGEGYDLYVADVNLPGNSAWLQLYKNEMLVEDTVMKEGSNFIYEEQVFNRDINLFRAKLDSVFAGNTTKAITLKDVWLIAGEQKVLEGDLWILQNKKLLKDLPLDSVITVGEEPDTFHVYTLSPGEYSSDCISCHAGNGVAPIKINLDTFKKGVHAYLNKNATCNTFITDEANKACWACHGNGSEPDEHPTTYLGERPPKPCISCHAYSQFDATPVYTHYQGSEISTNSTCWDCHSNAITNNTSENILAATSHDSTREDLLNTSGCDVCHNNETNAPKWGDAPQVTKHNADNDCTLCHAGEGLTTFHDKGITITRNCEDCHVDKQRADEFNLSAIITHYPGAPEDRVNTLKHNEYTCRVCHNATNKSLHNNLEIREYQNETMGYCFPCHSVEGEFPHKSEVLIGELRHGSGINVISGCDACHSPEGISKFHTPTLLDKGTFRGAVRHDTDCLDCHPEHEGKEYQPFEGILCVDCHSEYGSVHYAGAEVKMANQTSTCVLCHNEEADIYHNLTYFVGDVTDEVLEPCRDCHKDIESLMEHVRSLKIIGGTMATISHTVSQTTITCDSCHNVTGENRFHFDSYPMGTVQNPGWQNWTAGNVTICKDCHTYHGGATPFNATNMGTQGLSPSGTAHGFAPNCTLCHGGSDPVSFHTLATTQFVPRLAVTLNPEEVFQGETTLLEASVVLPPLTKVTGAEYFIDAMGKEGYGTPLEFIVGGSTDSSVLLGTLIETSDLSLGKHTVFVHVKDSSGKWSNIDIGVLIVKKPAGLAIIETLLRDIVPALIFIALLFLIWRRLR